MNLKRERVSLFVKAQHVGRSCNQSCCMFNLGKYKEFRVLQVSQIIFFSVKMIIIIINNCFACRLSFFFWFKARVKKYRACQMPVDKKQ